MHNTNNDSRFITKEALAMRLSVSPRTIEKHSPRMPSRVKIGRSVRYDWEKIEYALSLGKDIFQGNC